MTYTDMEVTENARYFHLPYFLHNAIIIELGALNWSELTKLNYDDPCTFKWCFCSKFYSKASHFLVD